MNSYLFKLTTKRFRQYFRVIDKMKHIDRWFTLMDTNTKRIHIDRWFTLMDTKRIHCSFELIISMFLRARQLCTSHDSYGTGIDLSAYTFHLWLLDDYSFQIKLSNDAIA